MLAIPSTGLLARNSFPDGKARIALSMSAMYVLPSLRVSAIFRTPSAVSRVISIPSSVGLSLTAVIGVDLSCGFCFDFTSKS